MDKPASAEVPIVLRVWGALIAALNILGALLYTFAAFFQGGGGDPLALGVVVIQIIFVRLGIGLYRGERQAVYGLCVLGGLALLYGTFVVVTGGLLVGGITIGVAALFYGVPILIAFRNWNALH